MEMKVKNLRGGINTIHLFSGENKCRFPVL